MIFSAHLSRARTGVSRRLRLVGLVDRKRVVRDELGERVRDPVEQVVQALLREDVVEDVCELAIGLDEGLGPRGFRVAEISVQGSRRGHSREEMPHGLHSFSSFSPPVIPRKGEPSKRGQIRR